MHTLRLAETDWLATRTDERAESSAATELRSGSESVPNLEHPARLGVPAEVASHLDRVERNEMSNRVGPEQVSSRLQNGKDPEPLFLKLPPRPSAEPGFKLLQALEGTVTSIGAGEFVARLKGLGGTTPSQYQATFDLENVSDDDRDLLALGAVFYWNVGYDISPRGKRELVSRLRFRRLPVWTRSELTRLAESEAEFASFFGGEQECSALGVSVSGAELFAVEDDDVREEETSAKLMLRRT